MANIGWQKIGGGGKMAEEGGVVAEIEDFIANWPGTQQPMREYFRLFFQELAAMEGVTLSFTARPGVSYSLRPRHEQQAGRDFFAIVDVIDDEPDRWLSVCFYADMIKDPEELGQCIPGGLAGSDGYCFDLNGEDSHGGEYLVARLHEARSAAVGD